MKIHLIIVGTAYESSYIAGAYLDHALAEKRRARIAKEQESYQRSLQEETPEWLSRKWSYHASYDYVEIVVKPILKK